MQSYVRRSMPRGGDARLVACRRRRVVLDLGDGRRQRPRRVEGHRLHDVPQHLFLDLYSCSGQGQEAVQPAALPQHVADVVEDGDGVRDALFMNLHLRLERVRDLGRRSRGATCDDVALGATCDDLRQMGCN